MNIILGALVRRIKQRAYLDTDEEIARWIEEYCEQSNSHKHSVSGKRPIIIELLKEFYTNNRISPDETADKILAACASGAVGTVAEARELIAECKRREDCLCGEECKLTIEEVRSSREGQP